MKREFLVTIIGPYETKAEANEAGLKLGLVMHEICPELPFKWEAGSNQDLKATIERLMGMRMEVFKARDDAARSN